MPNASALTLVYGEDVEKRFSEISRAQHAFLAEESDMNLSLLVAPSATDVSQAASAAPFLGTRRLVIVDDASPALLSALAEADIAATLPNFTTLIISAHKLDKRTSAFLYFKKHAALIPCEIPTPAEAAAYADTQLRTLPFPFSRSARDLFLLRIGTSLATIDHELSKYALLHRPITEADVLALTPAYTESVPFALSDALKKGNAAGLLREIALLYAEQNSIFGILPFLAARARALLSLSIALREGMPQDALAEKLSLHPFIVKKSLPLARAFTSEALTTLLIGIVDIESHIKHGDYGESGEDAARAALTALILRTV